MKKEEKMSFEEFVNASEEVKLPILKEAVLKTNREQREVMGMKEEWWVQEIEDAMQFGYFDVLEAVRDIILVEKTKAYNDGRDGRPLLDSKPKALICKACDCEMDEDGRNCGCNPHDA